MLPSDSNGAHKNRGETNVQFTTSIKCDGLLLE